MRYFMTHYVCARCHRGRTVVVSIHQPRYDVFALLDDVILLSRGHLVWAGSSGDMLKHFGALGCPCPALTNPADFILDISSIDVSVRVRGGVALDTGLYC